MAWANPCGYRNQVDGAYFDYVLVRGERDPIASLPPGPRWDLVGGARLWRLYRKNTTAADVPASETVDLGPCGPLTPPVKS
jgi:hypothetical protein